MRPWPCLLLAALGIGLVRAEERALVVRVDPTSDRVRLVDERRAWTVEGPPAAALAGLDGRRVRVAGRFGPDGLQLERLLDPRRAQLQAVPRARSGGGLELELPDGRRLRASGPAAPLLERALDRRVTVRAWVFAGEGEARVEAVRGRARGTTRLVRTARLLGDLVGTWPVGRLRAGDEVWVRERRASDMLLVEPARGLSGLVELERIDLVGPLAAPPRRAPPALPAGNLRQRVIEAIPGE